MNSQIYNRHLLALHRDRAANTISDHDFLFKASADDIVERAAFYNNKYESILDLGCRTGQFHDCSKGKLNFSHVYQADISKLMLDKTIGTKINCDEEFLPFAENSFDLVVSNLNLHWINKMFETLEQIESVLKPGGLFIATIIGGGSLKEMRELLIKAEMEAGSKVGFHISPMITSEAMVQLAQKTGFTKVIVDSHGLNVKYNNMLQAMVDLQRMGESNCMDDKIRCLGKRIVKSCKKRAISVSFEIITLSAFKHS